MKFEGALAGCIVAGCAVGAPIAITNHSFEADFAPEGNYVPLDVVQGWTLHDPNGVALPGQNVLGVLCPMGSGYYTPDEAPDGRNMLIVFILTLMEQGVMGVEQSLGVDLEPETTYTLRVAIGNIATAPGVPPNPPDTFPLDGFPGYAIQLLAGGVVIAEDVNTLGPGLDDGEIGEAMASVTTGVAVDPGLGLSIRLLNLNGPVGVEVNFDNVRLDASPACPADVNGDLVVDFADLNLLLGAFNQAGQGLPGDLDSDGDVDFADLNALLGVFNSACG